MALQTKVVENQAEQPPWLAITKLDLGGSRQAGVLFVLVLSLLFIVVPVWLGGGLAYFLFILDIYHFIHFD